MRSNRLVARRPLIRIRAQKQGLRMYAIPWRLASATVTPEAHRMAR